MKDRKKYKYVLMFHVLEKGDNDWYVCGLRYFLGKVLLRSIDKWYIGWKGNPRKSYWNKHKNN